MATVLLSVSTNTFYVVSCASAFGALTGRLVHPTAPVLLTKSGPLGTRIRCPAPTERVGRLTHLKFESRLRTFRPQGLQSFALPDKTALDERQLSCGKLRQEPATRWFD